ncbi:MAG: LysM peptidoglycan-binding domain-containing protein [Paludibacteraceae bacterium]|nr:LysM peptidoglycan-binding domain-containing protein [Paludibacteraceae bacterium]
MKRTLLILLASSLFAVNSFAQVLHAYDGNKNTYNYMIYLPENYQDEKAELPLVVFLHGKSLSGTDLSRVRRYGPLSALQYGRRINALVLAPQSPGEAWKPKKVNDLIDWTIKNYSVDTTRIYVIGMSMGGYGTLDYVGTYPKRVAAAIAMCGGTTLTDFSKMKDVPLWIIHGTDDAAVPVENSDKVNQGILAAGGSERLTKYDRLDSVNHAMLARMFYLNDTYDWLFKHTSKSKQRVRHETFDVRALLPSAYKGLKSGSGKIEQINIKDGQRPDTKKEQPIPAVTPEAKDTLKPTAKAETAPQEKPAQDNKAEAERLAQEKAAQEKAAQEKAEAERLAQEKAAKEKAERELAAKKKAEAAAKKKAEAEAAAKKKQQEELARKKAEEAKKKAEAARWYTVKNGDSQWSIAKKNNITVDQLRKLNKLTDKSVIHPGQKLRVKP